MIFFKYFVIGCLQCRYTLKYTYPYAYYMEGPRKELVSEGMMLEVDFTMIN